MSALSSSNPAAPPPDSPKSPIAEAYRSLRTTLLYSTTKSEVKSLIVSSAGPGDGKTTTVANLAITLANMGKKTILIDTFTKNYRFCTIRLIGPLKAN